MIKEKNIATKPMLTAVTQGAAVKVKRKFTTVDIEEAKNIARNIINRCKMNICIDEVVNESYENGVFVIPAMTEFVLNEKRRDVVSLREINLCTICNKVKAGMEFYYRTDYRNNHTYYIQPCIECHKLKYKSKKQRAAAVAP